MDATKDPRYLMELASNFFFLAKQTNKIVEMTLLPLFHSNSGESGSLEIVEVKKKLSSIF